MNENIKNLLVEEFKSAGLEIAEDAAVTIAKSVFNVLPKVLEATENKMDDMLIPLLAIVSPKIIELLEKIDGE